VLPSIGVALTLFSLLAALPSDEAPRLFLVAYSSTSAKALELSCELGTSGDLACKGAQLLVTKKPDGECTVRQWPIHGLPLQRGGEGRWQALLPSRVCTNFVTVYLLERMGKYRWQLTVESRQAGTPRDEVEARCSASAAPSREVYVFDVSDGAPKPGAMNCATVRLSP
jgi:hypothetical protein